MKRENNIKPRLHHFPINTKALQQFAQLAIIAMLTD